MVQAIANATEQSDDFVTNLLVSYDKVRYYCTCMYHCFTMLLGSVGGRMVVVSLSASFDSPWLGKSIDVSISSCMPVI